MTTPHEVLLITLLVAYTSLHVHSISISGGPNDRIVDAGSTFELECVGDSPVIWKYPDSPQTQFDEKNSEGSSTLIVRDADYLATGAYTCGSSSSDATASTYVFVKDEEHLLAVQDEQSVVFGVQNSDVVIPCRPTSPEIRVSLYRDDDLVHVDPEGFDPHKGFTLRKLSVPDSGLLSCRASHGSHLQTMELHLIVNPLPDTLPKPWINGSSTVVEGGTTTIQCNVEIETETLCHLEWIVPRHHEKHIKVGELTPLPDSHRSCYRNVTIMDATAEDEGLYTCFFDVGDSRESDTKFVRVFSEEDKFVSLVVDTDVIKVDSGDPSVKWVVTVEAYPSPMILWLTPEGKAITKAMSDKFEIRTNESQTTLEIHDVSLADAGNYSVTASNSAGRQTLSLQLLVFESPRVSLHGVLQYYQLGRRRNITCRVAGFPLPNVSWTFHVCTPIDCSEQPLKEVAQIWELVPDSSHVESKIEWNMTQHGILGCHGSNALGDSIDEVDIRVTEVPEGFRLSREPAEVVAGDDVRLTCAVPSFGYNGTLAWFKANGNDLEPMEHGVGEEVYFSEKYSHWTTLTMFNISRNSGVAGEFVCRAVQDNGDYTRRAINITVLDLEKPLIHDSNLTDTEVLVSSWKPLAWRCNASGVPRPLIVWYKDDAPIDPSQTMSNYVLNDDNSTLAFKALTVGDEGVYRCRASNKGGYQERTVTLKLEGSFMNTTLVVAVVVVATFLVILLVALILSMRKIRQDKRNLRLVGLYHFEKGATESLNQDLPLDEQTDLLPYDRRFEFPRHKLKLGKQLGAGAFGVVFKAEAQGIVEGEESTPVAVKMVKRDADPANIRALASELKILVHLGKHLNVVNLLGACTKQVAKRELLVIVEFCTYGNVHNYLLNHREMFIDQVDRETGEIDVTRGSMLGYSHRARVQYATLRFSHSATSDCNSMVTSGNTETSLLSCQPSEEGTLISITGSTLPEWSSNLQGDYRQRDVDLLTTSTLVAWGFQVARGMEYLASRRVLHGDLAARNVLLAENNVVKICDFGLAKSIYNEDAYQKKGNGPLPLKWMAIESVQDRTFSTQSDVWSFGIVLWEMFSLARTPYPGINEYQTIFDKLISGYRMPRPQYATQKLYDIMMECWDYSPASRPTFTVLAEKLGSILEQNVREHYIELNEPFTQTGPTDGEDYLSMVSPPTFTANTHYVNVPTGIMDRDPHNPGYMDMRASRTPLNSTTSSDENIELKPMLNEKERSYNYNDDYLVPRDTPASLTDSVANPTYELTSCITEDTKTKALPAIVKTPNTEYGKINDVKTVKDNISFFENMKKIDWRGRRKGKDGGQKAPESSSSNHYVNV